MVGMAHAKITLSLYVRLGLLEEGQSRRPESDIGGDRKGNEDGRLVLRHSSLNARVALLIYSGVANVGTTV